MAHSAVRCSRDATIVSVLGGYKGWCALVLVWLREGCTSTELMQHTQHTRVTIKGGYAGWRMSVLAWLREGSTSTKLMQHTQHALVSLMAGYVGLCSPVLVWLREGCTPLCIRPRKGSTYPKDVQQAQHRHVPFSPSSAAWWAGFFPSPSAPLRSSLGCGRNGDFAGVSCDTAGTARRWRPLQ